MTTRMAAPLVLSLLVLVGCSQPETTKGTGPNPSASATRIKFALNWVPEPEFGGFYAAQVLNVFTKNGLSVELLPGGAGAPTWQMVDSGQVPYAVASADEVLIARARGADVVALFATYQTCPQGIMVHAERGLKDLSEVFQSGTLAVEKGLTYAKFLETKYPFDKVKWVAYDGGVAAFLADPNYAQQCFVTSEPLTARKQGAKPKVFLVADAGYNPYTAVAIANGAYVKAHREEAQALVKALREGWQAYLEDPKPANDAMGQLNKTMDAQTFAEAAEAQKELVRPAGFTAPLGSMTTARWQQLADQLVQLKVLEKPIPAQDCFVQWP